MSADKQTQEEEPVDHALLRAVRKVSARCRGRSFSWFELLEELKDNEDLEVKGIVTAKKEACK